MNSFFVRKSTLNIFKLILITFFIVWISWHNTELYAKKTKVNIVILNTKDTGGYILCEKGIKDTIKKHLQHYEIRTVYLLNENLTEIKKLIQQIKPNILFTVGTRASLFAVKQSISCPVISTFIIDRTAKLITKKNIYKISLDVPLEQRVKFLCKIMPSINGAFISEKITKPTVINLPQHLCPSQKIQLTAFPLLNDSIELTLKKLSKKINAFFITPNPTIFSNREIVKYTLLWGLTNKIAVSGLSVGYVKNGALFAIEADPYNLGVQAAIYGIKILNKKAVTKGILHPKKLKISINLKTANRLRINIPQVILNKADFIIK